MPSSLRACILADDLTGAGDTGVQFSGQGIPTEILLNAAHLRSESFGERGALSVDLATRSLSPGEAYRRVRDALAALRPLRAELVYKKVDSGLRGNLAAELRAVLDALPESLLVLAPAFPDNGRTTVDGVQCIGGVPVTEDEVGRDALTPVKSAHIPTLLQREFLPDDLPDETIGEGALGEGRVWIPGDVIGGLTLAQVREGAGAVAQALRHARSTGKRLVVADAVERRDLAILAEGLAASGLPKVVAGSAGLAKELPVGLSWASPGERSGERLMGGPSPGDCCAHTLVVSLSIKALARVQLTQLAGQIPLHRIDIDPHRLSTADTSDVKACADVERVAHDVVEGLREGHVVLSVAEDSPMIESGVLNAALEAALESGMQALLGDASVGDGSNRHVGALVVVGGDTVRSVCAGIDCTRLELHTKELEPGVPLCRVGDGALAGVPLVMKSGSFGDRDTLVRLFHAVRRLEANLHQ